MRTTPPLSATQELHPLARLAEQPQGYRALLREASTSGTIDRSAITTTDGEPLFTDERVQELGDGIGCIDRSGALKPAGIDVQVLSTAPQVCTTEPRVQRALREGHGIRAGGRWAAAWALIQQILRPQLTAVVSGYATGGFPHPREATAGETVFDYLEDAGKKPGLVVTGGTIYGAPLIGSVIARHRGIPTVGVTPLQGADDLMANDTVIVHGNRYGDETRLIGSMARLLISIGGGPNSVKEYEQALKSNDTSVLLLQLNPADSYPPDSLVQQYQSVKQTARALKTGRLVVCTSLEELPGKMDELLGSLDKNPLRRRIARALRVAAALARRTKPVILEAAATEASQPA